MNLNTKEFYKIRRNAKYFFSISQLNTAGYGEDEDGDGTGPYIPGEGEAAVEATLTVKNGMFSKLRKRSDNRIYI